MLLINWGYHKVKWERGKEERERKRERGKGRGRTEALT